MSIQEHAPISHRSTEQQSSEPVHGLSKERQAEIDKRNADLDSLFDEIDGLLEDGCETMAASFTQKGGQ